MTWADLFELNSAGSAVCLSCAYGVAVPDELLALFT